MIKIDGKEIKISGFAEDLAIESILACRRIAQQMSAPMRNAYVNTLIDACYLTDDELKDDIVRKLVDLGIEAEVIEDEQ